MHTGMYCRTAVPLYRSVDKGYQRISRCAGHSATVRGVDWSVDSSVVVSNSNDYELLSWAARTGKQVRGLHGLHGSHGLHSSHGLHGLLRGRWRACTTASQPLQPTQPSQIIIL